MFPGNSRAAINAYRNVGVESIVDSATPQQLVVMLYSGAIAAIASAQQHIRLKNIAAKGEAISKAISIIDDGLRASLDLKVGGELALHLHELYRYMGQRLLHANLKNDTDALEEVRQLLIQLNGAWESLAAPAVAPAVAPAAATAAKPGTPPPARRSENIPGRN